jgi:hypothetical protein
MSKIAIFLAPDGQPAGVLDVLTDLSAAGLVDRFVWVRGEQVTATGATGITVMGGRRRTVEIQDVLADLSPSRIRLCVLVPVNATDRPVAIDTEQYLAGLVTEVASTTPLTRVRCILTRTEAAGAPAANGSGGRSAGLPPDEVLDRDGWHNVLLAPEDRDGPAAIARLLTATTDPVEVGRHAAPMVAGLLGLWTGVGESPLDNLRPTPGIRAGRAFYRSVDARKVERELRRKVLATHPELPRPKKDGNAVVYASNPAGACAHMEWNWWRKHGNDLVSAELQSHKEHAQPLDWRNALKMFYSYLWAALKTRVLELPPSVRAQMAARLADTVQNLCFGAGESGYEVVVKGRDRHGLAARVQELTGEDIRQLYRRLISEGAYQAPSRGDQKEIWKDYAWGAFTLADAGNRGLPEMGSLQESDGHPAVLRSVADCAPSRVDDFVITGKLATHLDLTRVAPGDLRGLAAMRKQLYSASQNPSIENEASNKLDQLTPWEKKYAHGYSALVANRVFGNLEYTLARIKTTIERILELREELRKLDATEKRRRWLAAVLGVLMVLGWVAGWILVAHVVIAVRTAVYIGIGLFLAWLVAVLVRFYKEQKEFFQREHRRRQLVSELEAALQNLERAMFDLRRLEEAYEQYLVWSRIVGEVLFAPYGPDPEGAEATVHVGFGLPKAAKTADADPVEDAIRRAAATLRTEQFKAGWLAKPWEMHCAAAGKHLDNLELESNPKLLFEVHGGVLGSHLHQWAEYLLENGTAPTIGDAVWENVRGLLDGPLAEPGQPLDGLKPRLLSSVRSGTGDGRSIELEEFLHGVDQGSASPDERFTPRIFSAQAQADSYSRVQVHKKYEGESLGLSRVVALAQLTDSYRAYQFSFGPDNDDHADEDDAEPEGPGGLR